MRDKVFYYGNSMRRVFQDGDLLINRPADFDELTPGDVIVFFSKEKKKVVVHRVIAKADGAISTIGDNNDAPDPWRLTKENELFLVTARVDLQGKEFAISRGKAGLREFRRHRFRRFGRKICGRILHVIAGICFFRRELPEPVVFGKDICYYHRGKLVARRRKRGAIYFTHWGWKLVFRLPKEKIVEDQ